MSKMDEIIIVVPRNEVFEAEVLAFQGVEQRADVVDRITRNIEQHYTTMRRGDAEENPAYKQPIPYCVIRRGQEIFLYKRLSGGGEARLHDKLSIGAGGHMNATQPEASFETILSDNLSRELAEELAIESQSSKLTTIGFINDDLNAVGEVHLGLLIVQDIDADGTVAVRETDQLEGEWVSVDQLREPAIYDKLESWSKIVVQTLT